jgi:hypothetical protein
LWRLAQNALEAFDILFTPASRQWDNSGEPKSRCCVDMGRHIAMARVISHHSADNHESWREHAHAHHHSAVAHAIVQWLFMAGLAGSLLLGVVTELLFGHILTPIWP